MKNYQINSDGSKINITISIDNNRENLLNNFELCKQGKCSCPTDEYKKLESLDIMEKEGVILLGLTPKSHNNFNIKEIEKCLEFSMNRKGKNGNNKRNKNDTDRNL